MSWCSRWNAEAFDTPYRVPEGQQIWVWGPTVPLALATYAVERDCFVTHSGEEIPQREVTHFSDYPPNRRPTKIPSLPS